jgi:hypothetical protein
MACAIKCGTQPADVHINGAFFNEYVVSPNLIQDLSARINALGVCHEKVK